MNNQVNIPTDLPEEAVKEINRIVEKHSPSKGPLSLGDIVVIEWTGIITHSPIYIKDTLGMYKVRDLTLGEVALENVLRSGTRFDTASSLEGLYHHMINNPYYKSHKVISKENFRHYPVEK